MVIRNKHKANLESSTIICNKTFFPFFKDISKRQKSHYRTVSADPLGTGSSSFGICGKYFVNRWYKLPI